MIRSVCFGFAVLISSSGSVILGCGGTNGSSSGDSGAGATGGSGPAGGSASTGGSSAGGSGGSGTSGSGGSDSSAGSSAGGSSAGTNAGGNGGSGPVTAQGCPADQEPGSWVDVTPEGMNLPDAFHGPITVGVDVVKPNELYVLVMEDGTWKSEDCGVNWTKVSTGEGGDAGGRPWIATIDTNPNRDSNTAPTMYKALGYGANGIWKSTNGGVDWIDVWNNNVFAEDGTTNIYADVGRDVSGAFIVDSSGPDHLIAYLHSYGGSQGNNGVFETTNGGESWIVHKAETFNFQPHSDTLFPVNATTWVVDHGFGEIYRTTNSAESWEVNDTDVTVNNLGRSYFISGSTIYGGTDYAGNVYKSTDEGASWTNLQAPGNQISWVVATATNVYVSNNRDEPHIFSAPIDDDTNWTDHGWPGMIHGGANTPGVLFDGEHYVLIAACEQGGIWRYVEE
jgi:hypothetical protein